MSGANVFEQRNEKRGGGGPDSQVTSVKFSFVVISGFLHGFEIQVVLCLRFVVDFHRESYHPAGTLAR